MIHRVLSLLVVSVFTLVAVADALACGMPRERPNALIAKKLKKAEKALANNRAQQALKLARVYATVVAEPGAVYVPPAQQRQARRIAGFAALKLERFEDALRYLERAGTSSDVREARANALVALGRADEARAQLKGVLSPEGAVMLARIEMGAGEELAALATLDRTLKDHPDHADARTLREQIAKKVSPAQPQAIALQTP